DGLTGHFNATGALVTGCLQNVDAYGNEAPTTPTVFECFRKERRLPPEQAWVIASNKSFGLLGGSKLRDWGDPCAANVILPKQFLVEAVKSAVSTDAGPGVEDRQALAARMVSALDEGYEGFGWRVHESGRVLGERIRTSLARSLLAYVNGPLVPSSGDELTFFMAEEIMSRLAPSLVLVNFWDIDVAHFGAYSLYLEAIRRTDRLVHGLWEHAQSLPPYRGRTTLIVVPEMGRDGDPSGNGFQNHRSGDESCRRVWLLAVGAGVPRGLVSARAIRTTDVAPTLARVLGFQMPEGDGRPQDETQSLIRRKGLLPRWREEVDQVFRRLQPQIDERLYSASAPRRLVVMLYGQGIAIERDKLWRRLRGLGSRVPLRLEEAQTSE